MEGLLRYDVNSQSRSPASPSVGSSTGRARRSGCARTRVWSDGKPVTAHDFVFAWRTAVDPATASQYAFLIYPVKNGAAINRGELPPEALGVRAAGDRVLEVDLENPIAYFDKLVGRADLLSDPRGLLQEPQRPLRRRCRRTCSTTARSASRAGCTARACAWRRTTLYWDNDCDLAQRHQHRVHHARCRRASEPVPGRPRRRRRLLARRSARSGAAAALAAASLQRRQHVVHRAELSAEGASRRNFHLRRALQLANDPAELVYKVLKTPSFTVAESMFPCVRQRRARAVSPGVSAAARDDRSRGRAREHLELAQPRAGPRRRSRRSCCSPTTRRAAITHSEYLQEYLRRTLGSRSASTGRTSASGSRSRGRRVRSDDQRLECRLRRSVDVRGSVRVVESQQPRPLRQSGARRAGAHRAAARSIRACGCDAFAEIQRILIEDARRSSWPTSAASCTCKTRA